MLENRWRNPAPPADCRLPPCHQTDRLTDLSSSSTRNDHRNDHTGRINRPCRLLGRGALGGGNVLAAPPLGMVLLRGALARPG
jgi:hypothetical protein